jgi:hypothetical protein
VFGIPAVPSDSNTPLRDMGAVVGERWQLFWKDVREKNRLS